LTTITRAESDNSKVDFNYDIRPILSQKCYHCHGPDEGSRKAKLRMDIREDALKDRDGFRAIVPGDIKTSEMIVRIHSKDEEEQMPPPDEGEALTAKEIELLTKWVAQGAEYKTHWAWTKPLRSAIPQVKDGGVVRNPVDAFILEKLPGKGLKQSPEADRHTLIRRLSLDLTGLPPTPDEVKTFVDDQSPDFYEKTVDHLLASPRFGERWAQMWLDLARYADSTGYGSDMLRLNIWPYRDWLINTLNHNTPYDQFTIEQLAGDLLPSATRDQITATAFHRNTLTNVEGGTIDEEYRVAAVKDRIATTSQVWMGITMQCAQCHTHKFDPITHKDYYSFYAIFNQTEDNDQQSEAPKIPLPTADETARKEQLQNEIADLEKRINGELPEMEAERHEWEALMARKVDWQVLEPTAAIAASGATLEKQKDGSLLAGGNTPQTDTYTVKIKADLAGFTALRLEAIPDPALPANGPGRAGNGNAVINEMRVALAPVGTPKRARYVIIERAGKPDPLSLAEVEVFSKGVNIAPKGKASQSTTDFEGVAARAIDGNTEGDFYKASSVTHTKVESAAWWEVDLGSEQDIDSVVVWNRTDSGLGSRLVSFNLIMRSEDAKTETFRQHAPSAPDPAFTIYPGGEQAIALQNPSADFSQQDWGVEGAIDGGMRTGWAFHPESGKNHAAVFQLAQPITEAGEKELTFTLRQNYGERHILGRFRLLATKSPLPVRELPPYIKETLALEPTERAPHQRIALDGYFRPISKAQTGLQDQLAQKRAALAAIKPVELPIMRELPTDRHRVSHILNKGNYLAPGEVVEPRLPEVLAGFIKGGEGSSDRLAVAKWLLHQDNPLTARVATNRFWSQVFGTGIVETEEDFGTQGALPSHPELLDWLAVVFQSPKSGDDATLGLGWDMKAFLRLLVTSATYRQSSQFTPLHAENDARNRYLSRYPRRRLEAETVRDQALALAGLLSPKIGGPSVYPPQPDGLWNVAFNGGQNNYPTSTGEDRYRRGIYVILRRTKPYPSLTTFDATSRESCTLRRKPTNTPLQAFVTLNDPCFVEAAQALARQIVKEGGADTPARIQWALNLVLGKSPSDSQIAAVQQTFDQELARQKADPAAAAKLATEPLGALPEGMDPVELATWTVIANTLLNLDAVLTKG